MKKTIYWLLLNGMFALPVLAQQPSAPDNQAQQDSAGFPAPMPLSAEQDHHLMMGLLHIDSIRRGADGSNPQSPFAANYDESKANPYPELPPQVPCTGCWAKKTWALPNFLRSDPTDRWRYRFSPA